MQDVTSQVLIVGAGPTGLTTAIALRRHGISVTLIEAAAAQSRHTKATNLMQGTQEQLAIYGLMPRMQERAGRMERYMIYGYGANLSPRNMHLAESPYPDVLFLGQDLIEANLVAELEDIDQPILYGYKLVGLQQNADRVLATLEHNGKQVEQRFAYVVGADGPRSATRTFTKCDFTPVKTGKWVRQIDAKLKWKRLGGMRQMWLFYFPSGFGAVIHLPSGYSKVMTFEAAANVPNRLPTLEEMQAKLREFSGDDTAMLTDPIWLSHGELQTGVAPAFVDGRVIIAGDAGNPILPNGGQGLNVGIQDGLNLSWKLADVLKGYAAPALLDTYEQERRSLRLSLEKVQRFTLQNTIDAPWWMRALVGKLGNWMLDSGGEYPMSKTFSQLGNNYEKSALTQPTEKTKNAVKAGHRILDADVLEAETHRDVSLFDKLAFPRWKLLLFDAGKQIDISSLKTKPWAAWVRVFCLSSSTKNGYDGVEVLYDIDALAHKRYGAKQPTALLARPDNYVAVRCQATQLDSVEAYIKKWFPGAYDVPTRVEIITISASSAL